MSLRKLLILSVVLCASAAAGCGGSRTATGDANTAANDAAKVGPTGRRRRLCPPTSLRQSHAARPPKNSAPGRRNGPVKVKRERRHCTRSRGLNTNPDHYFISPPEPLAHGRRRGDGDEHYCATACPKPRPGEEVEVPSSTAPATPSNLPRILLLRRLRLVLDKGSPTAKAKVSVVRKHLSFFREVFSFSALNLNLKFKSPAPTPRN